MLEVYGRFPLVILIFRIDDDSRLFEVVRGLFEDYKTYFFRIFASSLRKLCFRENFFFRDISVRVLTIV